MIKSYADLEERYGQPASVTHWEDKWLTLWKADIWEAVSGRKWCLPFSRMYVNRDIVTALDDTFIALDKAGLIGEIKTFDGCFCIRDVRGKPGKQSIHSWGLAVDFNALENPLGEQGTFTKEFLDVWRKQGWTCGADFERRDEMHFQLCEAF